jgi:phage tail-like protein
MRADIPRSVSPVPLHGLMPSVFQDDGFTGRFCAALDEVIAPVLSTLDCLDSYVDPALAPDDFLQWLGGWVGADTVEDWPIERKRQVVATAADLFRRRGTAAGLQEELELYTGARVEIEETGGVSVSRQPGGALPGTPTARLVVKVVAEEPGAVQEARVRAIVAAAKPAHVTHHVEVIGSRQDAGN